MARGGSLGFGPPNTSVFWERSALSALGYTIHARSPKYAGNSMGCFGINALAPLLAETSIVRVPFAEPNYFSQLSA